MRPALWRPIDAALVGIGLLLFGTLPGCARSPEQQAIAAIKELGGRVKLDEHGHAVEVDLRDTKATDADLACLAACSQLHSLNCSSTAVTGEGFDMLGHLDDLSVLFLVGSKVDDAGLAHLANLHALRTLHLGRNKITDAGLPALAGMTQLRTLSLGNTEVTDRGLPQLAQLQELGMLVLHGTRTTPGGVQRLRGEMCKTQIER